MSDFVRIDCGPMRPRGLNIIAGTYVTLFERKHGWVMIDSGYGTADMCHPNLTTRLFCTMMRTPLKEENCAIRQLPAYQIDPENVTDILLTHLHLDHAGGICDFPRAKIHLLKSELEAARNHSGRLAIGYNPRHWQQHRHWQVYQEPNASWFGFPAIVIPDMHPDVLFIPAPGHSRGHAMVAFQTGQGWVLQSGSAGYPAYDEDETRQARAPAWFKRWLMGNYSARLQALWQAHHDEITFLSSHEFRRASS